MFQAAPSFPELPCASYTAAKIAQERLTSFYVRPTKNYS
jgi:hypothetical protein